MIATLIGKFISLPAFFRELKCVDNMNSSDFQQDTRHGAVGIPRITRGIFRTATGITLLQALAARLSDHEESQTDKPLWAAWLWGDAGRLLDDGSLGTFTVIAGDSSGVSADIHDGIPVWLAPDQAEEPTKADADGAMAMLLVSEPPAMEAYRVSRTINSPRSNTPKLLDPVGRDFGQRRQGRGLRRSTRQAKNDSISIGMCREEGPSNDCANEGHPPHPCKSRTSHLHTNNRREHQQRHTDPTRNSVLHPGVAATANNGAIRDFAVAERTLQNQAHGVFSSGLLPLSAALAKALATIATRRDPPAED